MSTARQIKMRTNTRNTRCSLVIALTMWICGCGDNQPGLMYPSNLADDENGLLLPTASAVHYAHDTSILDGQTQATVVKRDDAVPPRQVSSKSSSANAAGVNTPPVQPANSLNEAFGNIGKALVSGLVSGPPAAGEANAGAPSSGDDSTPSGGALNADDQAAIAALVAGIDAAITARDLQPLVDLHNDAQKDLARQHYTLLTDTVAALDALGQTIETREAGANAKMTQVIDEFLRERLPTSAENVTATGPDSAAFGDFRFERENGEWKVEYAQDYQAHVDSVRALATSVQTGVDGLIDQVLDSGMSADAAIAEAKNLVGAK